MKRILLIVLLCLSVFLGGCGEKSFEVKCLQHANLLSAYGESILAIRSRGEDIKEISDVELILSADIQDYATDVTLEEMEYVEDYLHVKYHIQFDASRISTELMKSVMFGDGVQITMKDGSVITEKIE